MEEYKEALDTINKIFIDREILKSLSFEDYKGLMNDLLIDYNFILIQKVCDIRAYLQALDLFFFLLDLTEKYKTQLSDEDYDIYRKPIYLNILWSLDKMDLWEDYLDAWAQIKENTSGKDEHPHFYVKIFKKNQNEKYYHFLDYCTVSRKPIIESKVEKKIRGKKLGNLFHSKQSDFTEAELKDRIDKFFGRKPYGKFDNEKDVTPDN